MVARNMRSLTGELIEGATDGALKKPAPNWANRVDDETDAGRALLPHGVNEYDWSPLPPLSHAYVQGYVRGA